MNSHPDIDKTVSIHQIAPDSKLDCNDLVTIEEPMEIRISFIRDGKKVMQQVSVTMRTPGNDKDLAAGFLYSEGIISANEQINEVVVTGVEVRGDPQTTSYESIWMTKLNWTQVGCNETSFPIPAVVFVESSRWIL